MKFRIPRLRLASFALVAGFLPLAAHAAPVTWDASTNAVWTGPSDTTSWSGATYNDGDDASFLGAGAGTVSMIGIVNPNSVTVNSAADYTFNGVGIGGGATLTKSGTGTLTLTAQNTYTGGTTITDGTIQMNHGDSLGPGTIAVGTAATAKLLVADGITVDEAITVAGSGGGPVKLDSLGTSTFTGLVTVNGTTRVGNGVTLNFDGGLTSAATQLFIADANFNVNPLTLSGDLWQHVSDTFFGVTGNTWSKQVIAFGGSSTIGVNNALDTTAGIQFGWGANVGWNTSSLDLNGFNQEVAFIETVTSGQGLVNNQNITGTGGTLTVNTTTTNEYQGRITGGVSLVKSGTGTLRLENLSGTASDYTGVTTINAGTLEIQSDDALGSTVGETIIKGSTKLALDGDLTIAEPVTNQGGGQGKISTISGTQTFTAPITLEGSMDIRGNDYVFEGGFTSANNSGLGFNGSNYIVETTPITIGTGGFGVTSAGNNAANATEINVGGNDWGLTTINFGGYLKIGGTDFLPTDTEVRYGWSQWRFSNGTLDLNGNDQTVRALGITTQSDGLGGDHKVTGLAGDVLTISLDSGSVYDTYQGRFEGGLSIVKDGDGTLILENLSSTTAVPNPFTGPSAGPAVPSTNTGPFTISEGSVISRAGYGASDAVTFADASDLIIQGGATLELDYAGTDTVNRLFLGGTGAAAGTWGATGSGATNINDTFFTGTGTLTVAVTTGTYDAWALLSHGLTGADALSSADLEGGGFGDGLDNLLEFAFGTNPNVADNVVLTVTDGTTFTPGNPVIHLDFSAGLKRTVQFVRRVDHATAGLTYTAQFSDNLADWEDSTANPSFVSGPIGDYEVVEVSYTLFLSTGKKANFFRMKVTST